MKIFVITWTLLLGLSARSQGQAAAGSPAAVVPAASRTEEYCIMEVVGQLLGPKVTIAVDYGQEYRSFSHSRLRDAEGRPRTFDSAVDALSYQNAQGWELFQVYTPVSGKTSTTYYLMKRRMIR